MVPMIVWPEDVLQQQALEASPVLSYFSQSSPNQGLFAPFPARNEDTVKK